MEKSRVMDRTFPRRAPCRAGELVLGHWRPAAAVAGFPSTRADRSDDRNMTSYAIASDGASDVDVEGALFGRVRELPSKNAQAKVRQNVIGTQPAKAQVLSSVRYRAQPGELGR